MEPEEPTDQIDKSISDDSFNINDFKARMAKKIVKYGEPENSFIKNARATFVSASKEAEQNPYCKVST